VVSTPHPLALERALRGGDPAQVLQGEATDAFRPSGVPERLLLGADGAGEGLATLLTETGLDDEDARMYVAALTEPGALTAALNWYRAMDRGVLEGLERLVGLLEQVRRQRLVRLLRVPRALPAEPVHDRHQPEQRGARRRRRLLAAGRRQHVAGGRGACDAVTRGGLDSPLAAGTTIKVA